MASDPNARRDKALEGILGELRKTNNLLAAQGKTLERMEKHGRVGAFEGHPYLERSDGGDRSGSSDQESDASTTGSL